MQKVTYKKGQNITRAGERITAPQIDMLNTLGMLKDRSVDLSLYMGLGMLLLMLMLLIALYLRTFEPDIPQDPAKLLLLSIICVGTVGCCALARLISSHMMPVVLGAMLAAMLLKSRLAILVNVVLAVIAGLLASVDSGLFSSTMFSAMLSTIISGTVCVVAIRGRKQRFVVLMAGAIASVTGAVVTIAVALINSANTENMLVWAAFSAGGGVIASIMAMWLQLALEWLFNLGTNTKLLDLSNPNQLLLRRLMIEAPGTYHHSMIVANMAEAAANAIGANGLLARVGSYYHDIGKLKRPQYFKENQMNDNPHDRTDPRVSTAILTAHTKDGVEMAQRARMPESLLEIIGRHHGDTPVLYFYDKAQKQGLDVDISEFRYAGPRPTSAECAIVMLADTIEAAARSMSDSTPEKMSALIERLVRSKMDDGQLDDCELSFKQLTQINNAFLTVLSGVFHHRIEYPAVNIPKRERLECDATAEKAAQGDGKS